MQQSLLQKSKRIIQEQGIGTFFEKGSRAILRRFHVLYPYAYLAMPMEVEKSYTPESAVAFTFKKFRGIIRPAQVISEITALANVVEDIKPKVVVEIGTAYGGSLFIFSRMAAKDATIISVDLPHGAYGVGYPSWRKGLYQRFASRGQNIHLLQEDSHSEKTVAMLKKILGDREVDFLFIDGDHTYAGVKRDYELYSRLVRAGGAIGFHDVAKHPEEANCHVDQFWHEVRQGKESKEFIENQNQGWGGIGVVFK